MAMAEKFWLCSWVFLLWVFFSVASPPALDMEMLNSSILSFPSFSSNHALLLSSFKIFIYPPIASHANSDPRSLALPPQNAEEFFFHTLSQSSFVTHDAEAADLFFVPVSLAAMQGNADRVIGRSLKALVQQLRDQYPYWDRSLGADHFVTCCQRFKADDSRNVLELQKNAIWLACSELFGAAEQRDSQTDIRVVDSQFFPHKDLTMPPFSPETMDLSHRNSGIEDLDRRILVYVLDYPQDSSFKAFKSDSDFLFGRQDDDAATRFGKLSSSKFCLTVASVGHNITIVDGMRMGCVPVIVSDGHLQGLPFQDLLDWQLFSVVATWSRLRKLKQFLAAMPETKYREMQVGALAASRHLEWHASPKPYDAFHMLLHQLWLRRHTVRYSRRSRE